jgi:glycosyltransferase involved in cell wall biosynthesis
MRIALVSEGTYPFAMGGVSVWCDQLIRGLPDYRWEMVALTVDGTEPQVWPSPANLDSVRSIPLWRPRPDRRGRPGRGRGASSRAPRPRQNRPGRSPGLDALLPPLQELFAAMLTPIGPEPAAAGGGVPGGAEAYGGSANGGSGRQAAAVARRRFLVGLRGIYEYAAAGGDLETALLSDQALTAMTDAWRAIRPGEVDALSLHDACDTAWLMAHMLRPLTVEPVAADVVHASMNGLCMLVGMAAKWRHGTPVVMSEHGIYLRERYISFLDSDAPHAVRVMALGFFRSLAGAGYLIADALAPHSSYNRRWQLHNGADPARMWTMYNGVEPEEFLPAGAEPDEPTISFMGRIDPLKDLHSLIRAFAKVRERVPNARLRMYGGTPAGNEEYRDSCLRLIEELGLTGAAVLEGRVDTPVNAYHAGSIVALTSISEGFPYTVVEAMACGRTVVCTNVGGVAEAVADTGIVVPPRDVSAIADACVALLTDHERRARLGGLARERVLANFTLRRSLDAYRGVYERVAITPSAAPAAERAAVVVPGKAAARQSGAVGRAGAIAVGRAGAIAVGRASSVAVGRAGVRVPVIPGATDAPLGVDAAPANGNGAAPANGNGPASANGNGSKNASPASQPRAKQRTTVGSQP